MQQGIGQAPGTPFFFGRKPAGPHQPTANTCSGGGQRCPSSRLWHAATYPAQTARAPCLHTPSLAHIHTSPCAHLTPTAPSLCILCPTQVPLPVLQLCLEHRQAAAKPVWTRVGAKHQVTTLQAVHPSSTLIPAPALCPSAPLCRQTGAQQVPGPSNGGPWWCSHPEGIFRQGAGELWTQSCPHASPIHTSPHISDPLPSPPPPPQPALIL